jgi:hypothetical protein
MKLLTPTEIAKKATEQIERIKKQQRTLDAAHRAGFIREATYETMTAAWSLEKANLESKAALEQLLRITKDQ